MHELYISYVAIGLTVLVLSFSVRVVKEKLWLSEPLLAVLAGIAIGPYALDLVSPRLWGDEEKILEELARLTLAVSLIGVAFRLPHRWVYSHWRPLAVVLLAGMPLMWVMSSLCGLWILDLPVLETLLLAALIVPTDPVVASSIVTGPLAESHVEPDTRHLISAESGANDGLAFLLVMLPALLLDRPAADALAHWSTVVLFGKVLGSIAGGAVAGHLLSMALRRAHYRAPSEQSSLLAVSVAAAIALLGIARLLGGDGILAVFAAGLALNRGLGEKEGREKARFERLEGSITRFLDIPIFILFGLLLPWHGWWVQGWPLLAFGASILLLRRVPVVLVLCPWLAPVRRLRDALYVGWFGPIAVAAIVYVTWADVKQGYPHLWTIGSFVIFASIVVHGITATPLTRLYHAKRRGNGRPS